MCTNFCGLGNRNNFLTNYVHMISGRNCDGSKNKCCTKLVPCDFGEGKCKHDYQCKGTLTCGKNNCIGSNFGTNDNCCTAENPHEESLDAEAFTYDV